LINLPFLTLHLIQIDEATRECFSPENPQFASNRG
jgi:hypothetical protein